MDMIERVARAICKDRYLDGGTDDDGWSDLTEMQREDYRGNARAAIEAMREPTGEMCEAGDAYLVGGKEDLRQVFRAMIDEALKSNG